MMKNPALDLIGKQLGTYKVQSLIGSGGMAYVYQGLDLNLQRPVAIKVLSERVASMPGFSERFRQEARMIARLHHPHIVQVYNFGQQDDITYMVQELLPGPALGSYLCMLANRQQWPGRQDSVSIVSQLASALDAAHAAGIVHGDVKPGNALWNTAGALVLTDFGVAHHTLTDYDNQATGMIIGTPHYLSPEQAQGLPGTQRSDIYALGVVLYELLTGRVPFVGDTHQEVLRQHTEGLPSPLHLLRQDMPADVEGVVQQALAKNPQKRFASAGELAYALKHAWPPRPGNHETRRLPRPTSTRTGAHPPQIYDRTTIVAHYETLAASKETPAAAPDQPATTTRQRSRWQTGSLLLGTLLILVVLGSTIWLAINDEFGTFAATAPTATQTAPRPSVVATARLISVPVVASSVAVMVQPPTPTPEPLPTATITPDSTATPTATPEAAVLAQMTDAITPTPVLSEEFARLRAIIESGSSEGWTDIDRDHWLKRLDEIEQEVAAGNVEQASIWLEEMRQVALFSTDAGTTQSDAAQRLVESINRIATRTGITLSPIALPQEDISQE